MLSNDLVQRRLSNRIEDNKDILFGPLVEVAVQSLPFQKGHSPSLHPAMLRDFLPPK